MDESRVFSCAVRIAEAESMDRFGLIWPPFAHKFAHKLSGDSRRSLSAMATIRKIRQWELRCCNGVANRFLGRRGLFSPWPFASGTDPQRKGENHGWFGSVSTLALLLTRSRSGSALKGRLDGSP